jgi:hypothetical protein
MELYGRGRLVSCGIYETVVAKRQIAKEQSSSAAAAAAAATTRTKSQRPHEQSAAGLTDERKVITFKGI